MKADTFARLVLLDTLIEAHAGHAIERGSALGDPFREELVAAVSDLLDRIDALDALAAARVYDILVDFLAGLPETPEGLAESVITLQRGISEIIERGLPASERGTVATWAVVLDELLGSLLEAYSESSAASEAQPLTQLRQRAILLRVRLAAERVLSSTDGARDAELRDQLGRLVLAVQYLHAPVAEVDALVRSLQRRTRRYRRSSLSRVGGYVLSQLLRRRTARAQRRTKVEGTGSPESPPAPAEGS